MSLDCLSVYQYIDIQYIISTLRCTIRLFVLNEEIIEIRQIISCTLIIKSNSERMSGVMIKPYYYKE